MLNNVHEQYAELQAKVEELEKANTHRKNLNAQMLMNAAESGNRNYLAEIEQLQDTVAELRKIITDSNNMTLITRMIRDGK